MTPFLSFRRLCIGLQWCYRFSFSLHLSWFTTAFASLVLVCKIHFGWFSIRWGQRSIGWSSCWLLSRHYFLGKKTSVIWSPSLWKILLTGLRIEPWKMFWDRIRWQKKCWVGVDLRIILVVNPDLDHQRIVQIFLLGQELAHRTHHL